jgi:tetratricopeptide (TPR) repeat protein
MARWNDPDDVDRDEDGEAMDDPSAAMDPDDEPIEEDDDEEDDEEEDDGDEEAVADSDEEGAAGERRAAAEEPEEEPFEEDEDEDEEADRDADLDLAFEDDLEDEFEDFVDEELGYAEIDWDAIPEQEVDEHRRLRGLHAEALDGVDLNALSDFQRWAVARAYLSLGDETAFETVATPLLASKATSPALDYVDIALSIMSRKARRGDFDAAFGLLDQLRAVSSGDENLVRRFRGILKIQQGESAEGLELLAQLAESHPDDPDFLLSLGEDLCGIGLWEEAVEYLEIAEDLARERGDQDLLASIENAVQFAQRQIGFEDVKDD